MSASKSTTVRFAPGSIQQNPMDRRQRLLRSTFERLEVSAPSLSARLAARLWFRLPRPPDPDRRRRRMPTGGWPLAIDVPGVGRIRGIEFGRDDGPIALLVHGWAGWREQLSAFVEPLTVQGFRVVVVDLPGHGETAGGRLAGRSSTAVEMAEAIAGVARAVGPIRLVVAHSLGAMALVWAAARHDMRFDAAVMIAPIAAVSPVIDVFQAGCGFGPETRRRLVPLLERRLGRTLAEFDVPGMVGRILADRSVPLLVVHDATDDSAPSAGARAIADAWAGSDLELTVGLGHRKVLWDPAVVRRVADFAARTQQVAEL